MQDKFYRSGLLIYKLRWIIIVATFVSVLACLPLVPKALKGFTATGFVNPKSESAKADAFIQGHLSYQRNKLIVLYQSKKRMGTDEQISQKIRSSLREVDQLGYPHEIIYPNKDNEQISADKKSAFAVINLKTNRNVSEKDLNEFKEAIKKSGRITTLVGGEPFFIKDTNQQTQHDLLKAEYIATPIAVITLLIVFGSLAAAIVPVILDGICAIFILSILAVVGMEFSLSIFTLNISLLLGVCLTLDYALFIISRFRSELSAKKEVKHALAITQSTAGKAIFFSGLAVLASLSGLFFFPINILLSVAVGGVAAVSAALIVSIIILPAFLAVLNEKINFLPIQLFKSVPYERSLWMKWVRIVVKRHMFFFILSLVILFLLGGAFLKVKIGISDYKILPETFQSRQVFEVFKSEFSENQLTPITILIKAKGSILTSQNIGSIYDVIQKIKKNPKVKEVYGIVSTDAKLSKTQYQQLYTHPKDINDDDLKQLLKLTTHKNFTIVTVVSKFPSTSIETKQLINTLRILPLRKGLIMEVTGSPANTLDVINTIKRIFPYAFIWIVILSYFILLILLRSLFLPIKAIVMNILSLFASYGALVLIVQEGYFSSLLNFEAQGMVDISLLVIIFCALFGFSMDYEVFLLTRIKEFYEKTGDNIKSICYGITYSSKIVTSAAIVVILICFAFVTADILLVKAFGLGIAIAIFVDAFIIRTILVPATMVLLQSWNWYLPRWLDRILPKVLFHIGEDE